MFNVQLFFVPLTSSKILTLENTSKMKKLFLLFGILLT